MFIKEKEKTEEVVATVAAANEVETTIFKGGGWRFATYRRIQGGWMAVIDIQSKEAGCLKQFPVYSDEDILDSVIRCGVRINKTDN